MPRGNNNIYKRQRLGSASDNQRPQKLLRSFKNSAYHRSLGERDVAKQTVCVVGAIDSVTSAKANEQEEFQVSQEASKTERDSDVAARRRSGKDSTSWKGSFKSWGCSSVVDRQAAAAVESLTAARRHASRGLSIKALVLSPHIRAKKATYKVTYETLRRLPAIKKCIHDTRLLEDNVRLSASLAYVLCYELVYGEGVKPHGPAERAVLAQQEHILRAAEETAVCSSESAIRKSPIRHKRAVRVNTLKISIERAIKLLEAYEDEDGNLAFQDIQQDDLLPDVLLFPPGTDLHDCQLVKDGSLVLQSKASCMPAHALGVQRDWTVLDACAAPGNKTSHLSALMGGSGKIVALDRDPRRVKQLRANMKLFAASNVIVSCQDFLATDPMSKGFSGVQAVLLDPSCSGSGIVDTKLTDLLHEELLANTAERQRKRISALAAFQVLALRHAFKFPALRALVYSTCSVHTEENEEVVRSVLAEAEGLGFKLSAPFLAWSRRGFPVVEGAEKLVRVDPDEDGSTGFFIAMFTRATEQCLLHSKTAQQ